MDGGRGGGSGGAAAISERDYGGEEDCLKWRARISVNKTSGKCEA